MNRAELHTVSANRLCVQHCRVSSNKARFALNPKIAVLFSLVIGVVILSPVWAMSQFKKRPREMTLGEARALLVGKTVVVGGRTSDTDLLKGNLLEWNPALQRGDEYVTSSAAMYILERALY